MRILISGTASGLGAALHKRFGGEAYSRTSPLAPSGTFDMIVHCAVDTAKTVTHDSIESYFRNNVELTRRLLALRHGRFVFISTVDVYPKSLALCSEDAAINAHDISGVYGIAKFYSEALVRQSGASPLILRASALLGPSMRDNSLTRMLKAPGATIGLSAASTFNYILHDDIGDLIEAANREGARGIVNACSAAPVTLQRIADAFECGTAFGDFVYATPPLSNQRAAALVPGLARTSLETVTLFRQAQDAAAIPRPTALGRSI
jgi:nucleoside-diphosphate-sugar epimerase